MRNLKKIIFVGLLALLFIEIWLGFPLQLEKKEEQVRAQDFYRSMEAEKRMGGVHLVESRAGSRDWELYAESAEGYEGQGTWELTNVKVLFYNEDKVEFTVTGKVGKIDYKTKDMQIAGDVLTLSNNGYKFQSPSLSYFAGTRMLRSPEKVKMTAPPDENGKTMLLEGRKMEAEVDLAQMKITDGVSARKQLTGGKTFMIKSSQAKFSGKDNSAQFSDQVVIELDTMRMESPEAQFSYKEGVSMLQSILMRGGVKVSDLDKYATSETMVFDPTNNKFTLTGQPRVVQNNDEILGDRIIFIDGGKKVKVENIKAHVEKAKQ